MGGEGTIKFDEASLDDLIALAGQPSASSKPTMAKDVTFSSHKRIASVSFDEISLDDLVNAVQCQDIIPEVGIEYWLSKQWFFGESNYDLCLRKVRISGTPTSYRLPEGCSSAVASDAAGKEWAALATDGDGACALHAAFGAPGERSGELRYPHSTSNVFSEGSWACGGRCRIHSSTMTSDGFFSFTVDGARRIIYLFEMIGC